MATLTGNARVGEESSVVTRESMLETAQSIVEDKTINSGVIDIQLAEEVPRFQMKELRLGKILGRGAFCMAVEIDQFKIEDTYKSAGSKFFGRWKKSASREVPIKEEEDDDAGSNFGSENHGTLSSKSYIRGSFMSRDRLAKLAKKRTRKGALFAMKRVCPELQANNRTKYLQGLVDLAMEAGFLASLEHPNIVALCGVSSQGPSDFIILERLKETLSKRFKKWTQIDRQCKGITGVFTGSKKKINLLYEDKISAAFDVASAVDFLHQRNIVYRDLKPDNIGFDVHGILKLFDFGLAKELVAEDRTKDGLYKLTAFTGAIRYMAPEVALGKPYNQTCDVYSWSMIMWFILALEPPYGFYTEDMIRDRVHKRGSRPSIFKSWSLPIGDLMKRAWDTDISMRPSFSEIVAALRLGMVENRSAASGISANSAPARLLAE